MYEKYKQAALEWCNSKRQEWGMPTLAEMPCGNQRTRYTCPVAIALGNQLDDAVGTAKVYVGSTWYRPVDQQRVSQLGPWVQEFIEAFDAGRYPELVA